MDKGKGNEGANAGTFPPGRARAPPVVLITTVLPFLVMAAIALAPLELDNAVKYMLAVLACISLLWTLGSLPLAVTALLVPILLTLFGLTSASGALLPFGDPVAFLIVGGLFIAEAFKASGLDRRIAFIMVSAAGGDIRKTFLALMAVSAFLSMWISNTATVALLVPVVLTMAGKAGGNDRKITRLFLIGACIATAFGSMSTMIGTPVNAITSGLLAQAVPWTFLDWFKAGAVVSIVLLAFAYIVLPKVLPVRSKTIDIVPIKEELSAMGSLTAREKKVLAVFLPTIAVWIFGADIAAATGLPAGFLNAAVIALLAAFLLLLIKAMEWSEARRIDWDIYLIIGAGLALGEALESTGAAAWIASQVDAAAGGLSLLALMMVMGALSVLVTTVLSNTATVAILVPIVISVSAAMGLEPQAPVLVTAFCASISLITPVGTPSITIAYNTGMIGRAELARTGLVVTLPAMLIVVLLVYAMASMGWI